MERRDFIRLGGVAAMFPVWKTERPRPSKQPQAIILYDDGAVPLTALGQATREQPQALWVRKTDLPSVNGFTIKPEGACRDELCVPIPKSMTLGQYFDLTAFAKKMGQAVVADVDARAWSFSEMPVNTGAFLESRIAPDFAVPDRLGRIVRLSSFRGKKVLVTTWASW